MSMKRILTTALTGLALTVSTLAGASDLTFPKVDYNPERTGVWYDLQSDGKDDLTEVDDSGKRLNIRHFTSNGMQGEKFDAQPVPEGFTRPEGWKVDKEQIYLGIEDTDEGTRYVFFTCSQDRKQFFMATYTP